MTLEAFRELALAEAFLDETGGRWKAKNKKRRKYVKYDDAHIIAWDGEGVTVPDGTPQPYVFLANSTGQDWLNPDGLSTVQCFEAMLSEGKKYPGARHFIFGGSYDANQWLKDVDEKTLRHLWKEGKAKWRHYQIEYRPRRVFYISDGKRSLRMWDAYPWFQSSFVKAIEKNLGESYADLTLIRDMKARRSQFNIAEIDSIRDYTQRELSALVLLVRDLMKNLEGAEIYPKRWDGPGAAAAALLTRHGIKKWKGETPIRIRDAAAVAYSGGRMEVMQYGNYEATVYHYDINSAYPAAMADLPAINRGKWEHFGLGQSPPRQRAALYRVQWGRTDPTFPALRINYDDIPGLSEDGEIHFGMNQEIDPDSLPRLFPFPFRLSHGEIYYPPNGETWVWGPEFMAYEDHADYWTERGFSFELTEAYVLRYEAEVRPFDWVPELYEQRRQMKRDGNGAEKAIKLGLNSLYGKLAQTLGWSEDRWPPFYQIEWAGMITSDARAKLLRAAMQNPDAVIMFATDGIFSTEPLDLPISEKLGEWDQAIHDGLTVVQSGVYWVKEPPATDGVSEEQSWRIWSRGFNPEQLKRSTVLAAWGRRRAEIPIEQTRFITLGSALSGKTISAEWNSWRTAPRTLTLEPIKSGKRTVRPGKRAPHKGLVRTSPAFVLGESADNMSMRYERAWKDFLDHQIDGVNALVYESELTESES